MGRPALAGRPRCGDHGWVDRAAVLTELERGDIAVAPPRLGGMARAGGVVIVSERYWAFAQVDGTLKEGRMPQAPRALRAIPLARGLVRLAASLSPLFKRTGVARGRERLFLAVEQGDEEVWTSDLVISEVVYVLASVYKVSRQDTAVKIPLLLRLRALRLPNKRLYPRIFQLYTSTNLSYADCHTAALIESRGQRQLYSYDERFRKVPTLERLEP